MARHWPVWYCTVAKFDVFVTVRCLVHHSGAVRVLTRDAAYDVGQYEAAFDCLCSELYDELLWRCDAVIQAEERDR